MPPKRFENKYTAGVADEDPNGIKAMTTDVAGPFTAPSITKIMELQARADGFTYVDGEPLPDTTESVVDSFHSNHDPIMAILRKRHHGFGNPDDEVDEDETDEARRLRLMSDEDLQKMKDAAMDRIAVDAHNNKYIFAERERALKLQKLGRDVTSSIAQGGAAHALQQLEKHDDDYTIVDAGGTVVQGETDPLRPVDESAIMFDIHGDIERQCIAFTSMLKLRNDQLNAALGLIKNLRTLLSEEVMERARAAATMHEDRIEAGDKQTGELRKKLDSMKREQEFLYRSLYGAHHKRDKKVDFVKKYRREVDDTYRDMVEAEVTRRLNVAISHDTQSQRMHSDVRKYKDMMEAAHRNLEDTRWATVTAMKANVILEKSEMAQHDEFAIEARYSAAAATGVSGHRKVLDRQAQGDGAFDLTASMVASSSSATPNAILKAAIESLAHVSSDASARAVNTVASAARAQDYDEESVRVMSAAISETGTAIGSALGAATTQLMAVLELVPATARKAVMEASATTLMEQGGHVIRSSMAQLADAVLLPVKDRRQIFDRTVDAIRQAELADLERRTGVSPITMEPDDISRAVRRQKSALGGGKQGTTKKKKGTILQAAFPVEFETPDSLGGESHSDLPSLHTGRPSDDDDDDDDTAAQSISHMMTPGNLTPSRRRVSQVVFNFAGEESVSVPASPSDRALRKKSSSSKKPKKTTTATPKAAGSPKPGDLKKSGSGTTTRPTAASSSGRRLKTTADNASGASSASASWRRVSSVTKVASGTKPSSKRSNASGASSGSVTPSRRDRRASTSSALTDADASQLLQPQFGGEEEEDDSTTVVQDAKPPSSAPAGDGPLGGTTQAFDPLPTADAVPTARPFVETADASTITGNDFDADVASITMQSDPEPPCRDPRCRLHDPSHLGGEGDDEGALVLRPKRVELLQCNAARFNRCAICFISFGLPPAAWTALPELTPEVLSRLGGGIVDIIADHGGLVFRRDQDYVGSLFRDAVAAAACATDVKEFLKDARYPPQLLELAELQAASDLQGRLLRRGLQPRVGLHFGEPYVVAHRNVPGDNGAGPEVASACVWAAGDMAANALPGEIVCTEDMCEALAATLDEEQWCAGLPPPPADAFSLPANPRLRSAILTVVKRADRRVIVLEHARVGTAPPPPTDHATMGENSAASVVRAAQVARLDAWLQELNAKLTNVGLEKLCFVALEVQSEVLTTSLTAADRARVVVEESSQLVLAEAHSLVQRYDGVVTSAQGKSMLAVFPSAESGFACILAAHVRALQLPCTHELQKAAPWVTPTFIDDSLTWRGLRIRAGIHVGRPERIEPSPDGHSPTQYLGAEVSRALAVASHARFGETLASGAAAQLCAKLSEELGQPEYRTAGRRVVLGDLAELTIVHPRLLKGRWESIRNDPVKLPLDLMDPHRFAAPTGAAAAAAAAASSATAGAGSRIGIARGSVIMCLSLQDPLRRGAADSLPGTSPADVIATAKKAEGAVPAPVPAAYASMADTFTIAVRDFVSASECPLAVQTATSAVVVFASVKDAAVAAARFVDRVDSLARKAFPRCSPGGRNFAAAVGIDVGAVAWHRQPSGERTLLGVPVAWARALAELVALPGETLLSRHAAAALDGEILPGTLRREAVGDVPGLGPVTAVLRAIPSTASTPVQSFLTPAAEPLPPPPSSSSSSEHHPGRLIAARSRSDASDAVGARRGGSATAAEKEVLEKLLSDKFYNDARLPIQLASRVQHVYRAAWKAGHRATRVVGYPVAMDADPVAADVDLRDAIETGDEADSMRHAASTLHKVYLLLEDICLALACKSERVTKFHRTAQTAVMIAPFEGDDSALYAGQDVGTAGAKQRTSGGADIDGAGYRRGLGAAMAERLRERRIADLEQALDAVGRQLEESRARQATYDDDDVADDDGEGHHHHRHVLMPVVGGTTPSAGISRPSSVAVSTRPPPSPSVTGARRKGVASSVASPLQGQPRRPATTSSAAITGRNALSPLQVPFRPASSGMALSGQRVDDDTLLARPFGQSSGASRAASRETVADVEGSRRRLLTQHSSTAPPRGPRRAATPAGTGAASKQKRGVAMSSVLEQPGAWESLDFGGSPDMGEESSL